jgi:hypothetical protein
MSSISAPEAIDHDIDRLVYRWISRKTSVRKLAEETGLSRSWIHVKLKERCQELGINSEAGRGTGLWAVVSQEYLSEAALAKMRPRDRERVMAWAEERFWQILQSEGTRLYTTAECKNRSRRDTIGVKDLTELEDWSFAAEIFGQQYEEWDPDEWPQEETGQYLLYSIEPIPKPPRPKRLYRRRDRSLLGQCCFRLW